MKSNLNSGESFNDLVFNRVNVATNLPRKNIYKSIIKKRNENDNDFKTSMQFRSSLYNLNAQDEGPFKEKNKNYEIKSSAKDEGLLIFFPDFYQIDLL